LVVYIILLVMHGQINIKCLLSLIF